jgi:BirA family biotin operon repressor/biotin-[acetyl-CoA-carboxylase] ligase
MERVRHIGRRILRLPTAGSTNSVAAAHAGDLANAGLVVLADHQTAGRGRLGRSWSSPPGAGVLMSLLLFPPEELQRPALLTTYAAVAVCQTIFDVAGLQATIKWPNDVHVRGKKVCGILIEQMQNSLQTPAVIIGIGLNVNTPAQAFEDAGLTMAASLAVLASSSFDRDHVTEVLLSHLDRDYADLLVGKLVDLESRWRWHSGLLGRPVCVQAHAGERRGRLIELAFDGIILEDDTGNVLRFIPEEVERITALS